MRLKSNPKALIKLSIMWLCLLSPPFLQQASSAPLTGKKTIFLIDQDNAKLNIGTIDFKPENSFTNYKITWTDEAFTNHFLSMRPFKCLSGNTKQWCKVPYPYPIKRLIRPNDLTDLEYDLLFIWKGAAEYGINMWNGVYYRLKIEGQRIIGTMHEMDMDKLSAPPQKGNLRPIRDQDLEKAEASSHWLPKVTIE